MAEYRRPPLCRLCRGPSLSTGVQVYNEADHLKLSEWWLNVLQTELDKEEVKKKFCICQFCLWDAKFQWEHDVGVDDHYCDWWSGHDTDEFYKEFYYKADVIRPCEVRITQLTPPPAVQDAGADSPSLAARRPEKSTVAMCGVKQPTKCVYCGKAFESKIQAFVHVKNSHMDIETFECLYCSIHFLDSAEREQHIKDHRPKLRCHFCLERVIRTDLKNHVLREHPDQSQVLKCCNKRFANDSKLISHMRQTFNKSRKGKCIYCGEMFQDLLSHVKYKHKEDLIRCPWSSCSTFFLSHSEKWCHFEEAHGKKLNRKCVYCQGMFPRWIYPQHILLEHKDKAIRCDFSRICSTFFLSEEQKQKHILEVHLTSKRKVDLKCPKCDICGKSYTIRCNLYKHIREVHKIEVHACNARGCSQYFKSENAFKKHVKDSHSDKEKKFECPECEFRTHEGVILRRHVQLKHGSEKLKCTKCKKMYPSAYALKKHKYYSHPELRACVHCKSVVKELSSHLRVAPCNLCDFVVACKGLQVSHKKKCAKGKGQGAN